VAHEALEAWRTLPRRVYLDTSTLQKLYDFGEFVFEAEPLLLAGRASRVEGLADELTALHDRAAQTARDARVDQRAADAYLKVQSLAEQEAQWLEVRVDHLEFEGEDAYWSGVPPLSEFPKPAQIDRATASALLAAYGSADVRALHATWRYAADIIAGAAQMLIIEHSPYERLASPEDIRRFREELQPKERAARQALADAVAKELGHRQ
jgi:hypothetical protein